MTQLREQLAAFYPSRDAFIAGLPKAPTFAAAEDAIARLKCALPTPAPLLWTDAPQDQPFGGRTRTVLHATGQLGAGSNLASGELVDKAIAQIQRSLSRTYPALAGAFWPNGSLDIDYPGFRARAERHASSASWAIRVDHAMAHMPGAVLRVQAGATTRLNREGETSAVHFATRVAVGGYAAEAGRCAVPEFVHDLATDVGLSCALRPLTGAPWRVTGEEADDFIRFLEHPARYVGVLAIGRQASGWRLDADQLAKDTLGCGVVALLSDDAIRRLYEVLGRDHAVLAGAARMYVAGYHRSHAAYRHPLYLRNSLRTQFLRGEDTNAMLWQALLDHSTASDYARPYVPFADILASRNREDSEIDAAGYAAVPMAPAVPSTQPAMSGQAGLEETVRDLRDSLRHAKEQVRVATASRANLEMVMEERLKRREALPVPIPGNLASLPAWAERHLSGRLVVTPRARASVERSSFEDSDLVYEALCLLAFEYRDMCMGGAREPYLARLSALGLDESRSLSTTSGASSEYYVDYNGTRALLERHLKRGIARDGRMILRIYFFYDKREQVVVLGHLPDHLTTRQS